MEIHKQEFRVRDLPTRSVTLFPAQAQVVRDIKDVVLEPGTNQIVVVGFSPTVDESSFKVEGTGSAIISDMSVELLPNRDIFEDIYPDDDDDNPSPSDFDFDDDGLPIKLPESPAYQDVRNRIALLQDGMQHSEAAITSATNRLTFLEAYGKMLDRKRGVDIGACLETYRVEHEKATQDRVDGKARHRVLEAALEVLIEEEEREQKKYFKEWRREQDASDRRHQAKIKENDKVARRKREALHEKKRIISERQKYWPRKCYTVRITLDAPSFATPSSSRRSSVSSVTELAKPTALPADESGGGSGTAEHGPAVCDLAISYVTNAASWAPAYDMQLSTTTNTASLCFDAQLTNTTSESWSNCKVVLSTSQTTFSSLNDTIPELVPWRVKLSRNSGYAGILSSREEVQHNKSWKTEQTAHLAKQAPRSELFGVGVVVPDASTTKPAAVAATDTAAPTVGRAVTRQKPLMRERKSTSASYVLPNGTIAVAAAPPHGRIDADTDSDDDIDSQTMLPDRAPELAFQESAYEEMGMTTTYDLPGLKTLVPGSAASKQRVARVSFAGVLFSHTVVAKYRPVAYLQAKLKNVSRLTLLKGPAGLTLDGSFMGRTTLPRCSAGDAFTLNLGVDPAIRVAYPKPDVKRATTGLFTRENSSVYRRSITIANTRAAAGKAVTLQVLDQVPVSEDEKLRVDLQQPRGVEVDGGPVATEMTEKTEKTAAASSVAHDWGTATATLKKAGEIVWDVTLNAGQTVKLDLAYDVLAPAGEGVVQC